MNPVPHQTVYEEVCLLVAPSSGPGLRLDDSARLRCRQPSAAVRGGLRSAREVHASTSPCPAAGTGDWPRAPRSDGLGEPAHALRGTKFGKMSRLFQYKQQGQGLPYTSSDQVRDAQCMF